MGMLECKNPVIGVDLDDVLWDFVGAWIERYNEIVGTNFTKEDIKSWDVTRYIQEGTEGILNYIPEQYDFWETVEPIRNSYQYLWELMKDGYNIYIVTASHYSNIREKMAVTIPADAIPATQASQSASVALPIAVISFVVISVIISASQT